MQAHKHREMEVMYVLRGVRITCYDIKGEPHKRVLKKKNMW